MPKAPMHKEVNLFQPVQWMEAFALKDRHQMEMEHKQLDRFLEDLRDTCRNLDSDGVCSSCPNELLACCRGRLPSFVYDLLEICEKHFEHEESLLSTKSHLAESYEYVLTHQQAHAEILQALKSMQIECQKLNQHGLTAQGYRLLFHTVSSLFDEHARLFDDHYINPAAKRNG
jgi:hemerythrin